MTTVSGISSSTPTSSSTTSSASSTSVAAQTSVDYNSFLQLLVQELKNQDPTSPSDPTQYLSQIATFSNVQQAVQSNTTLSSILTNTALTQAEGVVGKIVTSSDGSQSGRVTSVALNSSGVATATLSDGSSLTLDSTISVGSGNSTSSSSSSTGL